MGRRQTHKTKDTLCEVKTRPFNCQSSLHWMALHRWDICRTQVLVVINRSRAISPWDLDLVRSPAKGLKRSPWVPCL